MVWICSVLDGIFFDSIKKKTKRQCIQSSYRDVNTYIFLMIFCKEKCYVDMCLPLLLRERII